MKIKLLVITLLVSVLGWGQFVITGTGAANTYNQNFDAFRGTAVTLPVNWAINTASYNATYPVITSGAATPTVANANGNNCYAGRASGANSDYAILQKNATSGSTKFTFSAVNNTGSSVSGFVINWNTEQFNNAGRATTVDLLYRINAGAYSSTGITGTTLTTATTGANTTFTVVQTARSITISGLNVANLSTVDFQFSIANGTGSGSNAHIGIDDFNIYATPTTPQPDINLVGNGLSILTGDTTPSTSDLTDYGNVTVGNNLGATFTIENLGPALLNIDNITITGSSAFVFAPFYSIPTIVNATPSSNPLSISFNPTVQGLQTATVTIISDDPDEPNYVFTIQGNGVGIPCTPAVIATIYPSSGAIGTEVTINTSSGNLTGATATFNGISANVLSSSNSQLVVIVPAGANTGNLVISDNQPCQASALFTVITKDVSLCQGTSISDLIIYEIHDEQSGTGGTITLFNGTATTKLLSNYKIYRTSNQNDNNEIDYATLTGSIAPGALGILRVKVGTSCTPLATNGTINGGFNANDGIQLRDGTGTTVIDDVDAYVPAVGYYMKRNVAGFIPRPTFVASDWTTITLASGVCAPGLGTTPIVNGGALSPTISAQPTVSITCASTSAILNVTATEGFVGGNALAYNWFAVAPNTTTWIDLVATPLAGHTGANTASLTITNLLENYQYYCQVRENSATCYTATIAVKISTGTTTWNGSLPWTNGTPTLSKAAIINADYNTGTNGSFDACNVTVNATRTLTIASNTYVNIENGLLVNGNVLVQDNGSLVQINDTATNSGNITVEREAVVNNLDYVYWSAPVTGQSLATLFPAIPNYLKWRWDATATNANGTEGNWLAHNSTMTAGVGYIVGNTVAATFTKAFTGATHNGIYNTVQIKRGSTVGITPSDRNDNWNLLGNPYPSAISVERFLDLNPELEGFALVWKHVQPPTSTVDPFYQDFVSNYYANDYMSINSTGNNGSGVRVDIASGQGFMVAMDNGSALTTTAIFNNSMRNKSYDNSQFFRSANTTNQNRIWLDISAGSLSSRTMFGYVPNATNNFDDRYDAYTRPGNSIKIYSVLNNQAFAIQGKQLPFQDSDLVPIGVKLPTNGTYTIAISEVDGLFANARQTIYLEDKVLNTVHNLSSSIYTFTGNAGVFEDRFVIRYTASALNTKNFDEISNQVFVYSSENNININSKLENIKSYIVFNVLGQVLASEDNLDNREILIKSIQKNNQALIIKTTLQNGSVTTKKLIF